MGSAKPQNARARQDDAPATLLVFIGTAFYSGADMRYLIFVAILGLSGCIHTDEARYFENPNTGEVVAACGPLTGFGSVVEMAQQACVKAYEKQAYTQVPDPDRAASLATRAP